jgi:hypothetical protein
VKFDGEEKTSEQILEHFRSGGKIKCLSVADFEELKVMVSGKGIVLHVMVLHDEECTPTICCCEPHFEIEKATAENFLEGEQAQAKWIRRTCS